MIEGILESGGTLRARAWHLGDRIDVRKLEREEALSLSPLTLRAGKRGVAVLFRYGAAVLFELQSSEEAEFLATLSPLVSKPSSEPETEEADILIDAKGDEGIDATGAIRVREASLPRLQTIAHVLAKSVVLAHYEERIAAVFEKIDPLAESLRRGGRRTPRTGELLNHIAEAMETQTRTIGRFEVGEKPELTWDDPQLDRLYERLRIEYELVPRDAALTRKLALVSDTAETLLDLLQSRRSLRLEWYIVILIFVEILLFLYDIFVVRG